MRREVGRHGHGAHRAKHRRRVSKPGAAPGTLTPVDGSPPPSFYIMSYGPDRLEEHPIESVKELEAIVGHYPTTWINVNGLGATEPIAEIGRRFGLHRLTLEDVVSIGQRAKVETYEGQLYIVAHMLEAGQVIETEQISIIVGKNYLLTFQVKPGDVFDPVRERIRHGRGRIRHAGPGYLAYALLDAVIDHYFPVLEAFGERLERLEEEVLDQPSQATLAEIMRGKRELMTLRRSIWPLRDAVHLLLREENPLIHAEDRYYFQDCYDHAVRVLEMVESQREVGSSLMDIYLSSVSNRMNEIMKVLTLFASIFIPLGFIAGLYGMNFNPERSAFNMPELNWPYGYLFALLLMASVAGGLLLSFWRRGWIGQKRRDRDRKPTTS